MTDYNPNNRKEVEALLKTYGLAPTGIDYVDRANAKTLIELGFRPSKPSKNPVRT